VTIHLDTSALIAALATPRPAADALDRAGAAGHRLVISTPVLFEWLRGPRTAWELRAQESLIPESHLVDFDPDIARRAARIYGQLRRSRHRDIDIAIAACAIEHNAALWTLHVDDFSDIPGLRLYDPA
jgi:predicted nucleic acid-binding protein